MNTFNNDFWRALDSLVDNSEIVIDIRLIMDI